ncbi:hypothetical protein SV7mr_31910 [Stieleria bergensis]|uniref:Uncharacterized protein n=1 Tax=Stieleria bergensis TaxID=2528025 RepID=A0A517SX03_9BACT|nr:hypothetical protein SV7mr_31910 [Planctomycetes bacterium SV_7m_r]
MPLPQFDGDWPDTVIPTAGTSTRVSRLVVRFVPDVSVLMNRWNKWAGLYFHGGRRGDRER